MIVWWVVVVLAVGILVPRSLGISDPKDCSPAEHLPCELYIQTDEDCRPDRLQAQFPQLYGNQTGFWPNRASSLDLHLYYKPYPGHPQYIQPGCNVTFTPPNESSIQQVKGFEMTRFQSDQPGNMKCYIFDLSNATWQITDMTMEFVLSLYPLAAEILYRFELYSLPKPRIDFDENMYQARNFYAPKHVDHTVNVTAGTWTFLIVFQNISCKRQVSVNFERPPDDFMFTKFDVRIVKPGSLNIYNRTLISDISHTFTNVVPGEYQISVKPHDEDFSNHLRCLCRHPTTNDCQQCLTTLTKPFLIEDTPLCLTTTTAMTTESPTSSSVGSSTEAAVQHPPGDNSLKVALAIVGCLLGLLLGVGVLGFCYWKRRSESRDNGSIDDDQGKKPDLMQEGGDNITILTVEAMKKQNQANGLINNVPVKKIVLPRKKVFIISEEDHDLHCRVVDLFAKYLHDNCYCDVMAAWWRQEAIWVHQDIQQADFVVIITSEAAFNIYMTNKFPGCRQRSGLTGVDKAGINCILNKYLKEQRYEKTIMVHFDYTDEKFVIPNICTGFKYTLMKHLTEFLWHIHGLKRTDNLSRYDLPLGADYCRQEGGMALMEAIKEAGKYERANPKWYIQRFGILRSVSNNSEESRKDSGIERDRPGFHSDSLTESEPEKQLLKYLESMSVGATTIPPPEEQPGHCYDNPVLDVSPGSLQRCLYSTEQEPSAPTSAESGQFDFYAPDDIDQLSRSLSEQMMSINKAYISREPAHTEDGDQGDNRSYHKDQDLLYLNIQSGDIPYETETDTISLGGDSI